MFQHILVALDGSARAEEALPLASRLARSSSATLILLRVVPTPIYPAMVATEPRYMAQSVVNADLLEAGAYLKRVITYEHLDGIQIQTVVLEGSPALTILQFAQLRKIDLLIIRSHGQTGFLRWMLGSVAQQLVRYSSIPVLVLRDPSAPILNDASGLTHPPRILVPLDGTSQAEAALLPAAQFVSALAGSGQRAAIHLTYAIHHVVVGREEQQVIVERLNKEARAKAEAYLRNVTQRFLSGDLAALHLSVTTSIVAHEDVGEIWKRILEESECIGDLPGYTWCDSIAMATHGRHGFQRLLEGSVTEHVLDRTTRPLLVVRAAQIEEEKLPTLTEVSHA